MKSVRSEQQDKNRWRRFVELAARWEEAVLAARFIEALRELPADDVKTFGGRTAGEWSDWAREKCSEFDPLRWPPGEVWCNLADGQLLGLSGIRAVRPLPGSKRADFPIGLFRAEEGRNGKNLPNGKFLLFMGLNQGNISRTGNLALLWP